MKNMGTKVLASALCFVFLASMLGAASAVGAASPVAKEDRKGQITEATGSTNEWGGGDYAFVRFGNDAYFGVLWGNQTHPNTISVLVVHQRLLGAADIVDRNGNKVLNRSVPIRVWTVYGIKLLGIFEYNDVNGDGMYNGIHVGDNLSAGAFIMREPIYKGVSMTTSWTRSDISKTENGTSKSYEFSLTADNLPYKAVKNGTSTNGSLDRVKFTFDLTASLVYVDGVQVPHFQVTVGRGLLGRYHVISSEKLEPLNYSGNRGVYNVKYSSEFDGWDFAPTDTNKSLLLEWRAVAAFAVPPGVVEWLKVVMDGSSSGEGKATYQDANGQTVTATGDDPAALPRKVGPGKSLEFGGNWTKVGRLTWQSPVTVDGVDTVMYAQVQGGKRIVETGQAGGVFAGISVLGGFSYPGGQTIIHDPGIDGDVLLDAKAPITPGKLPGILLLGLLVAVVVVIVVAFSMKGGRKKESFEDSYDRKENAQNGENWSEYYEKK